MKKRIAAVLLFILFPLIAFSANIDSSLYTGSSKQLINKYQKLLISLKTPNNTDYTTQKTILYTLINVLKYPSLNSTFKPDIKKIKTQQDYLLLFRNVAKLMLKDSNLSLKISDINKKLQLLKATITAEDNNSDNVMTYQLQYALYKVTLGKIEKNRLYLEKNLPKWKELLYKEFLKIKFDDKIPQKSINDYTVKYKKIADYKEKLNIEKDRFTLLNKTDSLSVIVEKLSKIKKQSDFLVLNIIDNYILIDLYYLQHSKDLTSVENKISEWIDKLQSNNNILFAKQEKNLLFYITRKKIGFVKAFFKQTENNVYSAAEVVWGFVTKPLFNIGNAHISIFNIVFALLIFIFGIYIGNKYKKHIKTARFSKNITLSTKTILGNIGYYTIILITFFISLKIVGINLSSLTVILGALSVGIGFGLQNMVSNFISGIILMLENSIRIGDYIEISDTLKGVVEDIQMRSTTIVTNDNIEVIIPNQTLFQNNVINWTLTEKVRRFKIPFGVAYGTDVETVQKVIYDALKKSSLNYIKNVPDKAPEIKMVAMNSSSVDFNLDVWVKGEDVVYPRRTESKFLIMIYNALYENGITIPFPQMDIHVKEPVILTRENKTKD